MKTQKIGVALGSGSARGWAHIGVMQGLLELGINPGLTHLGLIEFYRGDEAIKEGRAVVDRKINDILALMKSL